ncbi:putative serine/threonine-protein phosphatase 5 [Monocercomonoides exilis]|uniref:putative serine/threonine-protein phosphatase 5 n=1 Tax=Monocercomonoides exilis TaxID=2049356 RepID=UPI003559DF12|nr:putative serine/threonine-protein phosphatase 5 [Monocercomonoides exilis]
MSWFRKKNEADSLDVPNPITYDYAYKLIDAFKQQKRMKNSQAKHLLEQTRMLLTPLPNCVEITIPRDGHLTVVGDTHGQYFDVLHLFDINGFPSEDNPYLFNGDFVDRGSFGSENALTLFAIKLASPNAIYLLRGNHEAEMCTTDYGFKNEVLDKYNEDIYNRFLDTFASLPICATINKKAFVTHGGLFKKLGYTIADINKINRFTEPGEEGGELLMAQMLWSDPMQMTGIQETLRPFGCNFGPNVTKYFLEENRLSLFIRSHEMREEGYTVEHDGHLITIFSAPNYCEQRNKAGFLILRRRCDVERREKEEKEREEKEREEQEAKGKGGSDEGEEEKKEGEGENEKKEEEKEEKGKEEEEEEEEEEKAKEEEEGKEKKDKEKGEEEEEDEKKEETEDEKKEGDEQASSSTSPSEDKNEGEKKKKGKGKKKGKDKKGKGEEKEGKGEKKEKEEEMTEEEKQEANSELDVEFHQFDAVVHPECKTYYEIAACNVM